MEQILTLFFQSPRIPWYASLITLIVGAVAGLMGALPWRSAAEAAKTERDSVRETNERLRLEILETEKQNAVLKAKTDLEGLKSEVNARMDGIVAEMRSHSEQDLTVASQQSQSLESLKELIKELKK